MKNQNSQKKRNGVRDAAAAAAGGGVAYAGYRIGQAAKAIEATAGNAHALTGGILKTSRTLKKQLTTFPTFARLRKIRLSTPDDDPDWKHDVATGGVEGAAGVVATDALIHNTLGGSGNLAQRLAATGSQIAGNFAPGNRLALVKKLGIGAGVGAVATGLIGAGLSALNRKKAQSAVSMAARLKATIEFSEPLTGKLAKDRFIKRIHDEDLDRRDANTGRAALAGAAAGLLLPGKARALKRAAVGAGAGAAGVLAVRQATKDTRDIYGERSRGAKQSEKIPAAAAVGVAGYGLLRKRLRLMSAREEVIELREKRELPASVKAGVSAAVSGAGLGLIPGLRRGVGVKAVLKSVAAGAGAGAAIGGGGTAIGSAILGKPKRGEGAPITKRAAIGGGITGAAAGVVGGVLVHRTSGGRRLLVKASKAWRPARLARKTGPAGAAAIGGVAGAIAGTAHAADEGQQVDTIDAIRKRKPTVLFSRLQATIEFGREDQPRYAGTKRYAQPLRAYGDAEQLVDAAGNATRLTQSQLVGAAWRTGQHVRRVAQRGGNLTRDVADVATGRGRTRGGKPEWEKSWFRNAVLTSGGAGAVLAHAVLRRKLPAYRMKTDAIEKTAKAGVGKVRRKIDGILDLSARLHRTIEFAYADPNGWDVRDGRGKSARVFAPGSTPRVRRKAEWHEKKDNQKKILAGLGVAGTAAGLAAGLAIGPEVKLRKLLRKRAGKPPLPGKIIDISTAQAG